MLYIDGWQSTLFIPSGLFIFPDALSTEAGCDNVKRHNNSGLAVSDRLI